ncbi:MAG: hypothetical protein KAX78_05760, partial [Phycisphaerae bacterium]|nr:hypothetical protein [Phycisphaerae bacterium]
HDADRKVDPEATEKMATSPFALYRRTFQLDDTFAGKKIHLYVAYLWHTGTIYVNGQQIATIVPAESIAKRTVDITDAVKIGAENEVKILVCNEPVEKPKTQKDHQAGICDDVWLLAGPAGPRIEKLRIWTSVENRKLHLELRLADVADRKLTVSGKLLEHLTRRGKSGRAVLQIPSQRLRFGAVGIAEVEVDLSPHWDELRLWNFEDPALYDLVLDLAADGEPVDQVAERIGLRETKIIAHQFYLNGKLTHARDLYKFFEKHGRRRYAQVADVRAFRKYVRMYKRAGWNLSHSFSAYEPYLDTVLDVMDEEGLMYYPLIMGVSGYTSIKKDPQMFRKITEAIDHFGNHPSVIFWSMFTTGGFRTEESIRNPWAWTLDYGPKYPTKRSKQVREGHEAFFEHIRKCDPTRPVMFGTLTNFGEAITGFYYPNFGTPIQEIESWPVKWFVSPVRKAHWTLESTFYYLGCWADQKLWKHKGVWAEQVYENAARSLGPKAYTSGANVDPSPNIRPFIKHPRPGDRLVGDTIMHTGHNPVYLERMNHFATRVMRSWRAYDVACCGLGDELAIMYDVFRTNGNRQLAVHPDYRLALEKLKTPGPKVDTVQPYEKFINLTEPKLPLEAPPSDIYESMRENATGPFLAFIAHENGKLGSFTRKDHAYASGRQIAKNIVLINDHAEPRKVSFQVRFGRSVIKEAGMLMQPGHIQLVRVSLKAPQVKVRTEFKIELTAEIAPGKLADLSDNVAADIVNSFPAKRTDSFAVQVFPDAATKIDAPDLKIVLYDEAAHTGELMKKANLSFTPLKSHTDLKGCDLLVVGRDSFTDKFRRLAAEMDLESQISSGACDMLIFEQARSRCAFDRELINASARRTFIADKTHPAVAGLTDDDMADWRGDTDLQTPAPPVMGYMRPGTPYFPKWTNEGVVSSFPLSKPEYGNFRVIVDCWFDLGFAALFEAFCGSGSVMFCQLDVTNHRFGTDPAATRIVRNLFAYYAGRASAAKVDPFGPVWRLQGDARAEKLLTDRGVKSVLFCPEAAGGTLVIVGGASDAANVADYVAAGGKVLYLIDVTSGVDSSLLPGGV